VSRHSRRATRALRRLGEADPALAALALWCRHADGDTGAVPARSDGTTIRYGPGFEALPLHEQVGLAAHHVLHVAFRHAARSRALGARFGGRYDPALYNLAADAIVNQVLVLAGHALPRPCPLLGEVVAEVLGEDAGAERALARFDAEALYVCLAGAAEAQSGARGETRRPAPAEGEGARLADYARTSGFAEDLEPAEAEAGESRGGEAEAEWRQRLARAFEAGRLAGVGVGALGPLLGDLPRVDVPWEVLLRRLVTRAVTQAPRTTHRRPSRRWLALDDAARQAGRETPPFEPGVVRDGARPRIAACIDASTSIDDDRLALFAAQVAGIGRRTGAEVHVLVFDEGVRSHAVMRGMDWEGEIARVAFARGGGTSFVEVVAAAAALAPSIIVVLTDLDGPFGKPPERMPVIWAVPGGEPARQPPFGRVLSLAR
jgi:predicted metal-dependent peptidase